MSNKQSFIKLVSPNNNLSKYSSEYFPFTLISIALFLLCLTQDGYLIEGHNPRAWAPAWGLLLIGWIGVFDGIFAWIANPLLIISWVLMKRKEYKGAMIYAAIALLISLSFLLHEKVISSESGSHSTVASYENGYWLWLLSEGVILFGAAMNYFRLAKDIETKAN